MIRHYGVSLDAHGHLTPLKPVLWTALVPPGWQGFCCHCRRRLDVHDWQNARVAAIGNGNPWHCLCMEHLGKDRPEYQDALNALLRAVKGA